jgi:hypothetical protein
MILLTSTNDSLELVTSSTADIDWTTAYADHSTSAFTPGSNQGTLASATDTTIVAAPAASTQRQVKLITIRNRHASSSNTVTVQKDVSGTEYQMTPAVTLQAGETLIYVDGCGFSVLDASGRPKIRETVVSPIPQVEFSPCHANTAGAGVKTITTTNSFALYMGKAPRALTSIQMRYRVTTAAATITWAEVALAKGTVNVGGNSTLTVVGFADVSAVVNSTGLKTTTVNVSSGQSVNEGDDLWLIFGNQATTALIVRADSGQEDLQTGMLCTATTRPSTIVGTGTAFTIEANTALPAMVAIVY